MAIEAQNAGEWKVRIERPVFYNRIDFYIFKHSGEYTTVVQPEGMMMRLREGESLADIKPSLSLSDFEGRQMMFALAAALAEEGVKTPNDHQLKGQLDAQSAHLQDLRTLLKLNKTSGDRK